ncbi:YceI family protein [Mangrovimonas sp. AS39]|uniref:YceI family protein n=1 Tax=Mangrovimonas futianensis TaxID=2895523 RepID=UPI001E484316|nr:YceI family protein [Mangrovimonas futianensis]MCF1190613.1 YceI family protein [Mangrovimonas futianensis]MCF1194310.1 YceI family protein [Mangrovimonas futianensis]
MKKIRLVLCVLTMVFSINIQAQQSINNQKSKVEFKIKGGGLFTVKGTFSGMKGDFKFDPTQLNTSKFDICIEAASIDTDNNKRDTHLKSPDFFEVETYPSICFNSKSVSKTKDGFETTGDLTIHGVTKTVTIPFGFKNNTFEGSFAVNRFDYKIGEDIGTFKVGEEAEVTIICHVN